MPEKWKIDLQFLEEGDILFYFIPRSSDVHIAETNDIGSFYVRLHPKGTDYFRTLLIGQNKLPLMGSEMTKSHGFIEDVSEEGSNPRPINELSAGAGTYAILFHENKHTHLIYSLEVPQRTGKVQRILNIKRKGNFIISIRNEIFTGKEEESSTKYIPANPVTLLDQKGLETLLIASGKDYERLGVIHI